VKRGWTMALWATAAAAVVAALSLGGCASLGYYWQSAAGHVALMAAAKPVPAWLEDPEAPDRLKRQLELSQRIRRFASDELGLPDNPSYTRYADLRRPAVVWNVAAAPEFSLELYKWCFPVAGCVGYRGYFDEAAAQAEAAEMRRRGYEAVVYPVPAYSTLGWMNWAGGDPLLNTFIQYPEGELARLIFHELAHQVLYVKDDMSFNEAFATAVERIGGAQYLATQASEAARAEHAAHQARRLDFRALVRSTRERLAAVYDTTQPPRELGSDEQRRQKDQVMRDFRAQYAAMRERWNADPARLRLADRWVANANNASFGAQAAYDEFVPGFEALFEREGRDWGRFYAAVRELAQEPRGVRRERLREMGEGR
jgi:predicted aminopeptidase